MRYCLPGKVAIVTGSADGLGTNLIRQLLAAGARVIGIDINAASITHVNYIHLQGDITVADVRAHTMQAAITEFGGVDMLVNNAATGIYTPSYESSDEENKRVYDVNLFAPLAMIALVAPHFIQKQSGMIVNIGSICGSNTCWALTTWSFPHYLAPYFAVLYLSLFVALHHVKPPAFVMIPLALLAIAFFVMTGGRIIA